MLLESFLEELELMQAGADVKIWPIDMLALGECAGQSFIVEMRVSLMKRGPGEAMVPRTLALPHVGTITVAGPAISFEASPELKANITSRNYLLGTYLKETVGHVQSKHLMGRTWENVFHLMESAQEDNSMPFEDELLSQLGTDMLISLRKNDGNLKKVPAEKIEEAFFRCMHDAIVCSAGIEFSSIGCWTGNGDFEPDRILLESARVTAQKLVMDERKGTSRARRLIIEPSDKS